MGSAPKKFVLNAPFAAPERSLEELKSIGPLLEPLAVPVNRLTLEITKYCDVGCIFCKYHVLRIGTRSKVDGLILDDRSIQECLQFCENYRVRGLVVTGGGEPTYEMPTVLELLRKAACTEISLYTAGQWGESRESASDTIRAFDSALHSRSRHANFTLRLSVDDFHEQRLGVAPPATVIAEYVARVATTTGFYLTIRTVLHYEEALTRVVDKLGARLRLVDYDHRVIEFVDLGVSIPVLAMNLVPSGRLATVARQQQHRFVEPAHVRALSTKNFGPRWPVVFDGGLNIGVRPSGKVYLYGGTPEDYGRVPQRRLVDILRDLAADPINRHIYNHGIGDIIDLVIGVDPDASQTLGNLSDPPLIVPTLLAHPARLLLAKLWFLGRQLKDAKGRLPESAHRVLASFFGGVEPGSAAWFDALRKRYHRSSSGGPGSDMSRGTRRQ